jgi:hypothetical protein
MAAARRKFVNVDYPLPNGEKIRIGVYDEDPNELTVKLRLPGEWSIEWFARGVSGAKQTTQMLTRPK